jgi:hypothetical protein
LSIYDKPINIEISIVDSQLLQMLKFCQNGNGEVVTNLYCNNFNLLVIVKDNSKCVDSEVLGTVKILSRKKEMECSMEKKIRVSIRLQLERSFSMLVKQRTKLMEDMLDSWCRGQEKGLCQSLENLCGTSMGCGFLKAEELPASCFRSS